MTTPPPLAPDGTALVIEQLQKYGMSLHVENVEHGDYQRCPACRAEFVLGRGQHRSDCPIQSAITHLAELQARCARLEEDGKRLDWLDKNRNWWAPGRHVDGYEQISRAAIDAARTATIKRKE